MAGACAGATGHLAEQPAVNARRHGVRCWRLARQDHTQLLHYQKCVSNQPLALADIAQCAINKIVIVICK